MDYISSLLKTFKRTEEKVDVNELTLVNDAVVSATLDVA